MKPELVKLLRDTLLILIGEAPTTIGEILQDLKSKEWSPPVIFRTLLSLKREGLVNYSGNPLLKSATFSITQQNSYDTPNYAPRFR